MPTESLTTVPAALAELLDQAGVKIAEFTPDDFPGHHDKILAIVIVRADGGIVLVLPAGQDPDVRDRIVCSLLASPKAGAR